MKTSIWIDMDCTLFDFAKGDVVKALTNMKDPNYYLTLTPDSRVLEMIGDLSDDFSINVISGIPDLNRQGKYLGEMDPDDYRIYYERVKRAKLSTLDKYFGEGFFDTVEFTKASESKGELVRTRWYGGNKSSFNNAILIDDFKDYCVDWRKRGGRAIWVHDSITAYDALRTIQRGEI